MRKSESKYRDHPRISWFGHGGQVAYVDYISATESYCIVSDGCGMFNVVSPSAGGSRVVGGFGSVDGGIEYALTQVDVERARRV